MSGHRNVWKILVMVTGLSSITGVEAGEGAPFTEQQKADAVVRLLKSFGGSDPHALDVVDQHRYVQHNPRVEDGLAGLKKRLATLPLGSNVKVVRVLADGDFIITHSAIARRNTGPSSIRRHRGDSSETRMEEQQREILNQDLQPLSGTFALSSISVL